LALLLLLCVSTGRDWLGRRTTKGRVLLLDNELHTETIQNRIHAVATAAGIVQRPDDAAFDYIELRGEAVGIGDIECQLSAFQPGDLTLIVMDAKYRFFSTGMQENSNDDQTAFHNACDRLAKRLNCVIVLVHHSTKGDQGGKSVTDVGSGGGSQARAADCHMILRPHEGGDDLCVLDAELRTFKKVESQTLRWSFPLWSVDESVEATVKQAQTRNDATSEKNVKTKITSILQMLRLAPGNIHSENKLSNNHAASPAYRAAIAQLQETGEIEWLDDFKEPRAQQITGGWRLSVRSDS
jgi:RecA-family ATPase